MALSTPPNPGPLAADLTWVAVHEVIEIKNPLGVVHSRGAAVVLDDFPSDDPDGFVGMLATIRTPDGRSRDLAIGATRNHGRTISLFFPGLVRSDVPSGSTVGLRT